MCKVLMIAGIKEDKVDKAWQFAQAMAKPMSRANTDGLGYSAITAQGQLFGERWLRNDDAFKAASEPVDTLDSKLLDQMGEFVETYTYKKTSGEIVSNSYGNVERNKAVAITLHTRMATCEKSMANVHPFVYDGVSLIHNGMIRNHKDFDLKVSTCDSEAILQAYLGENVRNNPENFPKVAEKLTGYFACGVLTNTDAGPILDVFKSYTANLHATFVNELGTFVLSTSDTDIKDICKDLGWTHGTMFTIRSGKFIRMNAITGERINNLVDFSPSTNNFQYNRETSTNPTQATSEKSTKVGGTNTGSVCALPTSTKPVKVYDLNKHRNDKSAAVKEYYSSGKGTLVKLSERDVADMMMKLDRGQA